MLVLTTKAIPESVIGRREESGPTPVIPATARNRCVVSQQFAVPRPPLVPCPFVAAGSQVLLSKQGPRRRIQSSQLMPVEAGVRRLERYLLSRRWVASETCQERPPLSLQLAESVSLGARLALSHCQQLFRWRPWNCPAADFSLRAQRRVTREAALVSALTAAGVVHSVTRNCSRGDVPGCGCDDRLPQGLFYRRAGSGGFEQEERQLPAGESEPEEYAWQWGGCSEAPLYGQAVASRFLDGSEQPMDATAIARRHNHRVGIEVVRGSMETRCKCHGTSGSCSVQTCWRLLRPFHHVAARLERLYHDAIRINYDEQLGSIALGNSATMDHPDVSPEQLIYIEQSPNYCLPNRTSGWHGVRGRSCPKEVLDSGEVKDHCRDLCAACGFAVSQDARIQTVPCHFIFNDGFMGPAQTVSVTGTQLGNTEFEFSRRRNADHLVRSEVIEEGIAD
ncbi:protein Wnt-8b-like [Schistocerca serialis cubense]|uniref:protein Wnt-8b-like n=1 Tax=Schistocerca serialis cubense TaxID=2023355 RepID=UPI00214EB1DC|nr:protein Wnt-8b-like [Schistocerca serialis cubense]